MANDRGSSGAGVLLAFVAGAAVGAAVALLFAPASGEETRDYLGQRARDGRERASEAMREGREILNRQRDSIASALDRVRERAGAAPESEV
jgi:gas vesicle protein